MWFIYDTCVNAIHYWQIWSSATLFEWVSIGHIGHMDVYITWTLFQHEMSRRPWAAHRPGVDFQLTASPGRVTMDYIVPWTFAASTNGPTTICDVRLFFYIFCTFRQVTGMLVDMATFIKLYCTNSRFPWYRNRMYAAVGAIYDQQQWSLGRSIGFNWYILTTPISSPLCWSDIPKIWFSDV